MFQLRGPAFLLVTGMPVVGEEHAYVMNYTKLTSS